MTPSEMLSAWQRSSLSTRSRVLREANRRGRWFAVVSRAGGGQVLGRAEAGLMAADSAAGRDVYGHCAVPDHWRNLFIRTFVKAAIAARGRNVSVRST